MTIMPERTPGAAALNEEKRAALKALKTVRGQVEGIIRMIEEGRYCVDISNQLLASSALLKRANVLVLRQHMHHCVRDAVENGDVDAKLDEISDLLAKVIGR